MWPNAAAGCRQADHEVVHSDVWQEPEPCQQRHRGGAEVLGVLYENCPVASAELAQSRTRKRSMLQRPLLPLVRYQTTLRILSAGKFDHICRVERFQIRREIFECTAYKQRLALPMAFQEGAWAYISKRCSVELTHEARIQLEF